MYICLYARSGFLRIPDMLIKIVPQGYLKAMCVCGCNEIQECAYIV